MKSTLFWKMLKWKTLRIYYIRNNPSFLLRIAKWNELFYSIKCITRLICLQVIKKPLSWIYDISWMHTLNFVRSCRFIRSSILQKIEPNFSNQNLIAFHVLHYWIKLSSSLQRTRADILIEWTTFYTKFIFLRSIALFTSSFTWW